MNGFPGNAGGGCRHFCKSTIGKISWRGLETRAGGEQDGIGDVRTDAICEREAETLGLSTYLFGKFKCEYLKFIPLGWSFHEDWHPGDALILAEDIDFKIEEDVFPIFFYIKDLHEQSVPYEKSAPKDPNKFVSFQGTTEVKHKPTICNFWHFEFIFLDNEQEEIKKADKAWKKAVAHFLLKSILKEYAFVEMPEEPDIQDNCFKC